MNHGLQSIKQQGSRHFGQYQAEMRTIWLEMIQADVPALVLAVAFAVGTLVSMVPIPVVDMLLAGLVMRLLHQLPRGPILAAMAMWNNVIMAPVYATSPRVGGLLLSSAASHSQLPQTDALLPRLVVGNLAIAVILATLSFCLAAVVFSTLHWKQAAQRVQA